VSLCVTLIRAVIPVRLIGIHSIDGWVVVPNAVDSVVFRVACTISQGSWSE